MNKIQIEVRQKQNEIMRFIVPCVEKISRALWKILLAERCEANTWSNNSLSLSLIEEVIILSARLVYDLHTRNCFQINSPASFKIKSY